MLKKKKMKVEQQTAMNFAPQVVWRMIDYKKIDFLFWNNFKCIETLRGKRVLIYTSSTFP